MSRALLAWCAVWAGLVVALPGLAASFSGFLLMPAVFIVASAAGGAWWLVKIPLALILIVLAICWIRGDGEWREFLLLPLLTIALGLPSLEGPAIFTALGLGLALRAVAERDEDLRDG